MISDQQDLGCSIPRPRIKPAVSGRSIKWGTPRNDSFQSQFECADDKDMNRPESLVPLCLDNILSQSLSAPQ